MFTGIMPYTESMTTKPKAKPNSMPEGNSPQSIKRDAAQRIRLPKGNSPQTIRKGL